MRDKYEMQLRKLHAEMIEMGTMIEQAIETAIKALVAQDTELAKKAIEADDAIDHQEREIENLCLKLFLTQQPVAGDMRKYIRSTQDDNGYGEDRRSRLRYIRTHTVHGWHTIYKEA